MYCASYRSTCFLKSQLADWEKRVPQWDWRDRLLLSLCHQLNPDTGKIGKLQLPNLCIYEEIDYRSVIISLARWLEFRSRPGKMSVKRIIEDPCIQHSPPQIAEKKDKVSYCHPWLACLFGKNMFQIPKYETNTSFLSQIPVWPFSKSHTSHRKSFIRSEFQQQLWRARIGKIALLVMNESLPVDLAGTAHHSVPPFYAGTQTTLFPNIVFGRWGSNYRVDQKEIHSFNCL